MPEDLYNSRGLPVAVVRNGNLYNRAGDHVGFCRDDDGVFVGLDGRYLGEIYAENRLVFDRSSRHRAHAYPVHGRQESIMVGGAGIKAGVVLPEKYQDVDPDRLG